MPDHKLAGDLSKTRALMHKVICKGGHHVIMGPGAQRLTFGPEVGIPFFQFASTLAHTTIFTIFYAEPSNSKDTRGLHKIRKGVTRMV